MRAFAAMLEDLGYPAEPQPQGARMADYFRSAPDPDRGWALAALTDGIRRACWAVCRCGRMLADLTVRFIDPELYRLSRDYVGDTAETDRPALAQRPARGTGRR